MKYARIQVLPETPPGGLTAGVDWGSADHAVCVVDTAGQVRARFTVAHDRVGIRRLIAGLRAAGVSEAAIERSDGVLVDALLEAGLTVLVITSRQVKNLRSRYGSAGVKDDRFDAFVLADVLRTDRARLRPLVVDTPATAALRAAVRARRDLVAHRIAACNQLRAHLAVAFPGAVGLFARLDSPISLAFLARFGSQDAAGQLSEDDRCVEGELDAQFIVADVVAAAGFQGRHLEVVGAVRLGAGDLDGVVNRAVDTHRPIGSEPAQRRTVDELHHDEVALVGGVDVVDGDDVAMIQRGGRPGLLREAVRRPGALGGLKDFDRHLPAEARVLGLVDNAHAATAQFAPDGVA